MTKILVSEGHCDSDNGVLNLFDHSSERGDDRHPAQFLFVGQAYSEGRLEARFLVECPVGLVKDNEQIANRADVQPGRKVADFFGAENDRHLRHREANRDSDGENEMVLVAFVENLDGIEVFVPARMRFEFAYLVEDIFRGEMHLSGRDGSFKTISSSLREGEADGNRIFCLVAHHGVANVVERRAKVVDRIADDQGEMVWDGVLGLDINQSLRGVFALRDSEFERVCREKFVDLPIQAIDVVFGPLDL